MAKSIIYCLSNKFSNLNEVNKIGGKKYNIITKVLDEGYSKKKTIKPSTKFLNKSFKNTSIKFNLNNLTATTTLKIK